jgi:hypothetical protein
MFKKWTSSKKGRVRAISTPTTPLRRESFENQTMPDIRDSYGELEQFSGLEIDYEPLRTDSEISDLPGTSEDRKSDEPTSEKTEPDAFLASSKLPTQTTPTGSKGGATLRIKTPHSAPEMFSRGIPNFLGMSLRRKGRSGAPSPEPVLDERVTGTTRGRISRSGSKFRAFFASLSGNASSEQLNSPPILLPTSLSVDRLSQSHQSYRARRSEVLSPSRIPSTYDLWTPTEVSFNRDTTVSCILEEALRERNFDNVSMNSVNLTGRISGDDGVLFEDQLPLLLRTLPERFQLYPTWKLLYSTSEHGTSLRTLYSRNRNFVGPTMLAMLDMDGCLFGCFASESWKLREGYYGTGECYLWKVTTTPQTHLIDDTGVCTSPKTVYESSIEAFHSTGANSCYMLGTEDFLAIGSGYGNFGLWLDDHLYHGTSKSCPTFDNQPLACQEDFTCRRLEIWGLTT